MEGGAEKTTGVYTFLQQIKTQCIILGHKTEMKPRLPAAFYGITLKGWMKFPNCRSRLMLYPVGFFLLASSWRAAGLRTSGPVDIGPLVSVPGIFVLYLLTEDRIFLPG